MITISEERVPETLVVRRKNAMERHRLQSAFKFYHTFCKRMPKNTFICATKNVLNLHS